MSEASATTEEAAAEAPATTRSVGMWKDAFHQMRRRPDAILSAVWIVIVLLMAAVPQLFTSKDYLDCHARDSKIEPQWFSGEHLLGTNVQGCDYYAMTIAGARPSMVLALCVIIATLMIAVVLGSLSGYYGGWFDTIISRAVEVFYSMPFFLGALMMLTLFRDVSLGSGQLLAIIPAAIALTIFGWMGDTRMIRASVMQAKNFDYVQAARSLGASDRRLMFRHILPNAIAPVMSGLPLAVSAYVTTEAALSALGLGVRPPATSWGRMIAEGAPWVNGGLPHLLLAPGIALLLTIFSFALLGDALRDALDPKLR